MRSTSAATSAKGWQWGARISQRLQTENGLGLTAANPAYCTSIGSTTANSSGSPPSSCSYQDVSGTSGSIPVSLDYYYAGWQSPGGFYTQLGRFTLADYLYIPKGLQWNGQNVTGVIVGVNDPQKTYGAWVAYLPPVVSNFTYGERERRPRRSDLHHRRRAELGDEPSPDRPQRLLQQLAWD